MNDQNTEMRLPDDMAHGHHAHTGPILGVITLVLVLIFAGLYLWGGMLDTNTVPPQELPIINDEPETPRATVDQEILQTVSPSDEIDAIEADLNSTNFDSLDTDLNTIDAELGDIQPM